MQEIQQQAREDIARVETKASETERLRLTKEIDDMRNSYEQQLAELRTQLNTAEQYRVETQQSLDRTISDMRQQLERELQSATQRSESKVSDAYNRAESAEQQLVNLKQSLAEEQKSTATLQAQLDKCSRDLAQRELEVRELLEHKHNVQLQASQLQSLQKEMEMLQRELSKNESHISDLTATNAQLADELHLEKRKVLINIIALVGHR